MYVLQFMNSKEFLVAHLNTFHIYINFIQLEDGKVEQPVRMKGRVKASLIAQLPEELNLYSGDLVNISHIVDKDWFR